MLCAGATSGQQAGAAPVRGQSAVSFAHCQPEPCWTRRCCAQAQAPQATGSQSRQKSGLCQWCLQPPASSPGVARAPPGPTPRPRPLSSRTQNGGAGSRPSPEGLSNTTTRTACCTHRCQVSSLLPAGRARGSGSAKDADHHSRFKVNIASFPRCLLQPRPCTHLRYRQRRAARRYKIRAKRIANIGPK